jgi:hypothetical protein
MTCLPKACRQNHALELLLAAYQLPVPATKAARQRAYT